MVLLSVTFLVKTLVTELPGMSACSLIRSDVTIQTKYRMLFSNIPSIIWVTPVLY